MIIIPYSTALRLNRKPIVTWSLVALCCLVFVLQVFGGITEYLLYYPDSWNPLTMLTSTVAHGGLGHILFNMIFYIAFAPALEILVGSWLRYLWIMVFIAFAECAAYSLAVLLGGVEPLPTLGFSGVVMGMIGLSAYLMPWARIKVFIGFFFFVGKTFHIPAWILAAFFIGIDTWIMLTADDYGHINVIAHVAGGFAGYLCGYLWLRQRKQETRDELDDEIEAMKARGMGWSSRAMAPGRPREMEPEIEERVAARDQDGFMSRVYRMVECDRDSDAVCLLMERYDFLETEVHELEALYERIEEWGPSRALLCLGGLIIYRLDQELRQAAAVAYIAKCQAIDPRFALPEVSRVTFFAQMAIQCGRPEVARNLLADAVARYGDLVDARECARLQEMLGQRGALSSPSSINAGTSGHSNE